MSAARKSPLIQRLAPQKQIRTSPASYAHDDFGEYMNFRSFLWAHRVYPVVEEMLAHPPEPEPEPEPEAEFPTEDEDPLAPTPPPPAKAKDDTTPRGQPPRKLAGIVLHGRQLSALTPEGDWLGAPWQAPDVTVAGGLGVKTVCVRLDPALYGGGGATGRPSGGGGQVSREEQRAAEAALRRCVRVMRAGRRGGEGCCLVAGAGRWFWVWEVRAGMGERIVAWGPGGGRCFDSEQV